MTNSNKYTEIKKKTRYCNESIVIHDKLIADSRGRLAISLIERWGLIMAKDDGEDTAGRHKVKALPADEVVKAACDIAKEVFREFKRRDWMLAVPDINTDEEDWKETNE